MAALDTVAPPLKTTPLGGIGSSDLQAHLSLAFMLALGIVCVVDAMIISSLITPIKEHFGLSDEQIGRLSSSFTIAGIVGAPLFGYLANRFGRKPVLFAGVALWSFASIASGWAEGFLGLLFWRVLTGFGEAAYGGLAPSWLADLYRPKWRNLVFSLYMLRNKIGSAVALALGGWLAAEYGWRVAFYIAGIPGLLLALVLLWIREPQLGASDGAAVVRHKLSFREGLAVFRYPGYLLHSLGLFFFFTAMMTQIWIPAYLYRTYAIPNQQASLFLAQVLLYTAPAGLIGGYLSSLLLRGRRWGFPAFLASTSLIAAPLYLLAYTANDVATSQALIVAGIVIFGLSAGTLTTLIVETVPAYLRTSAVSFSVVISGGTSGIVAPELIGHLSDAFGLQRALLVAPACYLLAGLVWLALSVVLGRSTAADAAPLSAHTSTTEVHHD
ncbi:MFS transporter [Pseudomonas sp.]|jgi:MFS family permease|uniref:MFS transporter n=1 Tax=Pseudomonas sp. TaxID=306 RepID=UPI0028B166ED|nr:MFS transporter [Pseudomonas sp.]